MNIIERELVTTHVPPARERAEELWREHAEELMRFASTLVGPDDAADVVSAAFINALPSLNRGDIDNVRAYLYRCVVNGPRNLHRSSSRRRQRELRASRNAPDTVHIAEPDTELLAGLSERQRAVVYLAYWCDYSTDQIAAALDISNGSVKKHLDRARTQLRSTIGGQS